MDFRMRTLLFFWIVTNFCLCDEEALILKILKNGNEDQQYSALTELETQEIANKEILELTIDMIKNNHRLDFLASRSLKNASRLSSLQMRKILATEIFKMLGEIKPENLKEVHFEPLVCLDMELTDHILTLKKFLKHKNVSVQRIVIDLLGNIGKCENTKVTPILIENLIYSNDEMVLAQIGKNLNKIGSSAIKQLLELVKRDDSALYNASFTFPEIKRKNKEFEEILLLLMKSTNETVRSNVVKAIGNHEDKWKFVEPLLHDPSDLVKVSAINVLGEHSYIPCIPKLKNFLDTGSESLQLAAISALGSMNQKRFRFFARRDPKAGQINGK